jgi:hypothetical protein
MTGEYFTPKRIVKEIIYDALKEGETDSRELAFRLSLDPNAVSSYLCELREAGRVRVIGDISNGSGHGKRLAMWQRVEEG